jgi:hypothetical protein
VSAARFLPRLAVGPLACEEPLPMGSWRAWVTDIERHQALPNPAVVKGDRLVFVAAGAL